MEDAERLRASVTEKNFTIERKMLDENVRKRLGI